MLIMVDLNNPKHAFISPYVYLRNRKYFALRSYETMLHTYPLLSGIYVRFITNIASQIYQICYLSRLHDNINGIRHAVYWYGPVFFKFSIRFISMKPYHVDMIGYKKDM